MWRRPKQPCPSLFIDMNAYFATVEQEFRPDLRGRPIGVVAVMTDSTCCIAVSREAKACGLQTGTMVHEARRKCPDFIVVEARPPVYIEFHHRIKKAIERCVPIQSVGSIDEMTCRLIGQEGTVENATRIALNIKQAIRDDVGSWLTCSIGLAPNSLLAKMASDMQKLDGLVVIHPDELPQRLYPLRLDDIPGVGRQMLKRLNAAGIESISQLCACGEKDLDRVWGSVLGERLYHLLRGEDQLGPPTHRRTVGHSHVLPPDLRNDEAARAVLIRLIHKAAARLRNIEYWAGYLQLIIEYTGKRCWKTGARLGCCQDTLTLLEVFDELWKSRPKYQPYWVSVTLLDLIPDHCASLPLFSGEKQRIELSRSMDELNRKFGANTIYFGGMHDAQDTAPVRIAFTHIPDLKRELQ